MRRSTSCPKRLSLVSTNDEITLECLVRVRVRVRVGVRVTVRVRVS